MKILDPRVDAKLVPDGSKPVIIRGRKPDDDYKDLPSVVTPTGYVITRWEPTPEERAQVAAGEDIYVTILARGSINPLFVTVGPCDWR